MQTPKRSVGLGVLCALVLGAAAAAVAAVAGACSVDGFLTCGPSCDPDASVKEGGNPFDAAPIADGGLPESDGLTCSTCPNTSACCTPGQVCSTQGKCCSPNDAGCGNGAACCDTLFCGATGACQTTCVPVGSGCSRGPGASCCSGAFCNQTTACEQCRALDAGCSEDFECCSSGGCNFGHCSP